MHLKWQVNAQKCNSFCACQKCSRWMHMTSYCSCNMTSLKDQRLISAVCVYNLDKCHFKTTWTDLLLHVFNSGIVGTWCSTSRRLKTVQSDSHQCDHHLCSWCLFGHREKHKTSRALLLVLTTFSTKHPPFTSQIKITWWETNRSQTSKK